MRPETLRNAANLFSRIELLSQDTWWVPLQGWNTFKTSWIVTDTVLCDPNAPTDGGYSWKDRLDALDERQREKVLVTHMDKAWRSASAAMLRRQARALYAAHLDYHGRHPASVADIEQRDAERWLDSQPLMIALNA